MPVMILAGVSLPSITNPDVVMVFDVGRILTLVAAAVLIGYVVAVLDAFSRNISQWQKARFACVIFAAVSVAGTEVGRLHAEVTWRFFINAAFLATAIYGVWGMRHGHDHPPDRKDDL